MEGHTKETFGYHAKKLTPLPAFSFKLELGPPAPAPAERACFKPADMNLAAASGLEAIARPTADTAAPCAVLIKAEGSDGALLAKISGLVEKYLVKSKTSMTRWRGSRSQAQGKKE